MLKFQAIHAGVFDSFNDVKQAKKFIDKAKKFNRNTELTELVDFFRDLKAFAEKKSGHSISYKDLKSEFNNNLQSNNINPYLPCFDDIFNVLFGSPVKKGVTVEELNLPGTIVVGTVLVFCSPLIAVIGVAVPPAAPICNSAAKWAAISGVGLILEGVAQDGDENRKGVNYSLSLGSKIKRKNSFVLA